LIPTTGACAAGIACPIDLPWDSNPDRPHPGPWGQTMTEDEALARIRGAMELSAGVAITADMARLALESCKQSQFGRLAGQDPAACGGAEKPVIYYGAYWVDSGGRKPLAFTTAHIYLAQQSYPKWSTLTYGDNGSTKRDWYEAAGLCQSVTNPTDPSKSTTCDEYPFWTTLEGGPNGKPTPSVVSVPRAEMQPQATAMSAFYRYAAGRWVEHQSPRFGVVPQVLWGAVLPLPTFWV
jgi:hypothetical protein